MRGLLRFCYINRLRLVTVDGRLQHEVMSTGVESAIGTSVTCILYNSYHRDAWDEGSLPDFEHSKLPAPQPRPSISTPSSCSLYHMS
jgi:hypothetical protein